MSDNARLHKPTGALATTSYAVALTPEQAGWGHGGLRIVDLPAGGSVQVDSASDELLVLPLRGSADVECAGEKVELAGRESVFSDVTDFAYVPPGERFRVSSSDGGRFALPSAKASRKLAFRYVPASAVPVELRGSGSASRQVNNFATPDALDADRLIACEVLTPAGNWSSYPPHKHDEERRGPDGQLVECALEEIYYFEVADGPAGPGVGYHRVYGTADRPVDVLAEVRTGDVVLVPHGWHGPSMAAPGYDLYYLNVMAGAGERRWLICDDPAHAWVRDTWPSQEVDARLPFYPATGRRS